jgi:hypothetical protein
MKTRLQMLKRPALIALLSAPTPHSTLVAERPRAVVRQVAAMGFLSHRGWRACRGAEGPR